MRRIAALFSSALGLVGCPESTTIAPDAPPLHCTTSTDCLAPIDVCDPDRHACVACALDGDCAEGEVCLGGDCAPRTACTSSVECPGLVCDPARGVCVECVAAIDCPTGETCLRGGCVPPALPACLDDGDCTAPERCEAGGCVPECV